VGAPGRYTVVRTQGGHSLADGVPIFPIRSLLLPYTDLGLQVIEPRFRTLVGACIEDGSSFGVVLAHTSGEPYRVGTLARIVGHARLPDGRFLLELEGRSRFRILSYDDGNGSCPRAQVEWLPETIGNFARARSASRDAEHAFFTYRSLSGDGDLPVRLPVDPVARSYIMASLLRIDLAEKQQLLEVRSADERLELETGILERESTLIDLLRSEER
jgi:uncharacterized protein